MKKIEYEFIARRRAYFNILPFLVIYFNKYYGFVIEFSWLLWGVGFRINKP